MNAASQLEQSHLTVMQFIDDLPEGKWDIPNVYGTWSVKDILAHITSYEHLLVDAFNTFSGAEPTAYLLKFVHQQTAFDKDEVEARQYSTAQQVVDEFNETQLQSSDLLAKIPQEKILQTGTMPWYGVQHCLADLVNNFCAHTQEHCDQIKAFRQQEPGA